MPIELYKIHNTQNKCLQLLFYYLYILCNSIMKPIGGLVQYLVQLRWKPFSRVAASSLSLRSSSVGQSGSLRQWTQVLTDGQLPSPASTLRTTVRRGYRLARPPGGSDEQPVVNCRNDFRSSAVMPTSTLTKRWKPGLQHYRNNHTNCRFFWFPL